MKRKLLGIVLAFGIAFPVAACGAAQPQQVIVCEDDDDCGDYENGDDDD